MTDLTNLRLRVLCQAITAKKYSDDSQKRFISTEISYETSYGVLKDISNINSVAVKARNPSQYDFLAHSDHHNKENLKINERKKQSFIEKNKERSTQTDDNLWHVLQEQVESQQETINILQAKISKLQIENIKYENALKVAQENIALRGKVNLLIFIRDL